MIGGTNTLGIARRGGCTCIDESSPQQVTSTSGFTTGISPPQVDAVIPSTASTEGGSTVLLLGRFEGNFLSLKHI